MKDLILEQPLVSVIIPVYNRMKTIKRAVDSVLNQTYKNIELIIVDDGSEDDTPIILDQLRNEKIQIFRQEHRDANVARNLGIKKAKGNFIAFQDSDDEWLPDKLKNQIEYMISNNYKVCYCPFYLYKGEHSEVFPSDYINRQKYEENLLEILRVYNVVSTQTLVIHREIIYDVGIFDEEMPRCQDYEYVIRIIKKKKIGYINKPLVKVYRSNDSISNDNNRWQKALIKLLEKHEEFWNIEVWLKNFLKDNVAFLRENELNERIENIDKYLKTYWHNRKINVYKIVADFFIHESSLNNSHMTKEYDMRIARLKPYDFAIYGMGNIGKKIYWDLLKRNLKPKYFLVTEKEGIEELYGIPVIKLAECEETEIEIIIGVSRKLQRELIENLVQVGCANYFRYPY